MMPLLKRCPRHARGTKFEPFVNPRLATGRCTSSVRLSTRFLLGLVFCCCCSINFSRTGGAQALQPVCPALLLSPTPSLGRTLQPLTSFPTQCRCRCARHAATFGSSSNPGTLVDSAWRQQQGQARSSGVVMQASGGWEEYLASGDRSSNGDGGDSIQGGVPRYRSRARERGGVERIEKPPSRDGYSYPDTLVDPDDSDRWNDHTSRNSASRTSRAVDRERSREDENFGRRDQGDSVGGWKGSGRGGYDTKNNNIYSSMGERQSRVLGRRQGNEGRKSHDEKAGQSRQIGPRGDQRRVEGGTRLRSEDFELVEEGTGTGRSWADSSYDRDVVNGGSRDERTLGAKTAYRSDLREDFRMAPPSRGGDNGYAGARADGGIPARRGGKQGLIMQGSLRRARASRSTGTNPGDRLERGEDDDGWGRGNDVRDSATSSSSVVSRSAGPNSVDRKDSIAERSGDSRGRSTSSSSRSDERGRGLGGNSSSARGAGRSDPRHRGGAELRMKRREERERIERERQASFFASLDARDGSEGNDGRATSAPSGARGDSIFGGYFTEEGGKIGGLERGASSGWDGGEKNERPLAQESRRSDRGPRDMEGFKGREGVGGRGQGVPRQGQRQRKEVGGRGGYAPTFGEERESERRSRESKAWMGAGVSADDGVSASARGGFPPTWKASLTGKAKAETKGSERLPRQGGLRGDDRGDVLPLPRGLDISVKELGIPKMEALLKAKFSKMKEGVHHEGVDDDVDFYDPDDEGYEPGFGEGEPFPDQSYQSSSADAGAQAFREDSGDSDAVSVATDHVTAAGSTGRPEADAASEGGFRMRPPVLAAAAAVETNTPRTRKQASGEKASASDSSDRNGRRSSDGVHGGVSEKTGRDRRKDEEAREKNQKEAEATPGPSWEVVSIKDIPTLGPRGKTTFEGIGILDGRLLSNVQATGIKVPTEVQEAAIRGLVSEDRDVIIHAHTGSGKTLAYLLPLIAKVNPDSDALQAVVVAPGRELASQIFSVCEKLIAGLGLRSAMVIGGANVLRQVEKIKRLKPQIVVATPGRLCEVVFDRRRLKLGSVTTLVLDEVDALLRSPYDREVDAIVDAVPSGKRLTVFASATGRSPTVMAAADRYMRDRPLLVGGQAQSLPANIRHTVVTTPKVKKFETLRRLLNTQPFPESVMIFVNDPGQVKWLTEKLEGAGIIAAPLSGDSSKDDRAEIMRRLQDKRVAMVVTTEMAARGLDVPHLTHVVNYDLATDGEHYVHRAGRCGRAGRPGIVVNLSTPDTKFVVRKFSKQLGLPFDDCEVRAGRLWAISRSDSPASVAPPDVGVEGGDGTAGSSRGTRSGGDEAAADGGGEGLAAQEGTGGTVVDAGKGEVSSSSFTTLRGGVSQDFEAATRTWEVTEPLGMKAGKETPAAVSQDVEDADGVEDIKGGTEAFFETDEWVSAGQREAESGSSKVFAEGVSTGEQGKDYSRLSGVLAYEVPGGVAVEGRSSEDAGGTEAGWDEDDWGDGDWGDDTISGDTARTAEKE